MSQCIAATKVLKQCKNNKHNKLFCKTHISYKPEMVFHTNKMIKFTTEDNYLLLDKKDNKDKQKDSKTDSKDTKLDIDIIIDDNFEEKFNNYLTLSTCSVCFENVSNNTELIKCNTSTIDMPHMICKQCLNRHTLSMLNDGIASSMCMFDKSDKCGGTYSLTDIHKVLENDELITKWTETMHNNEIIKLASICDNYVICPLCCSWGCIFEEPPGNKQKFYIPCGKCGLEWCSQCKQQSHGITSCYELHFNDNDNTEKRNNIVDKMLQDITTRTLTHSCTICGSTYIKEEGCNLMTCTKCNGMSCYICGMKLYLKHGTKYWHFTGHDLADKDASCPLWNNRAGDGKANQGNTDYNMTQITNEFTNFINANKNTGNEQLIKTRIKTLFYKDSAYKSIINSICK